MREIFLGSEVLAARVIPERAWRGDFVAGVDMGYRDLRVGIEYDGAQHWASPEQHARDIDRYTALSELGWMIIRVSSDLPRYRQGTLVARCRRDARGRLASLMRRV